VEGRGAAGAVGDEELPGGEEVARWEELDKQDLVQRRDSW